MDSDNGSRQDALPGSSAAAESELEFKLWRRTDLLKIGNREVEVEFAVSVQDDRWLRAIALGDSRLQMDTFVHIWCVRNHAQDGDKMLPKNQWAYGGRVPAHGFAELYYPVDGWEMSIL